MALEVRDKGELIQYTAIEVPSEIGERIRAIAERKGRSEWEIILDAIGYYEAQLRAPRKKEKLPDVEKLSWYISKISIGVALCVSNPTQESLEITLKMLESVRVRLHVDTRVLAQTLELYFKSEDKSPKRRASVMHALKMVIREILEKALEGELELESEEELEKKEMRAQGV
jgi:hypothetical protein